MNDSLTVLSNLISGINLDLYKVSLIVFLIKSFNTSSLDNLTSFLVGCTFTSINIGSNLTKITASGYLPIGIYVSYPSITEFNTAKFLTSLPLIIKVIALLRDLLTIG